MAKRLSFVADGRLARRVDEIAREYDLPTEEVLRQLITIGLEEIEDDTRSSGQSQTAEGSPTRGD